MPAEKVIPPAQQTAQGFAAPTPARSPLDAMEAENPTPPVARPPGMPPEQFVPAPRTPNPTSQSFVDQLEKIKGSVPAAPTKAPEAPAAATDGEPKKESAREKLAWTPKKSADWNTLRNIANQNGARVAELEAELSKLRGGQAPATPGAASSAAPVSFEELLKNNEQVKRLKEERDSFYEEIKHVRVEADPQFKEKFDSREKAAIGIARKNSGAAADEIAQILAIKDPDTRATRLAERIKDFGDGSKKMILAAESQLTALEVEKEIEINHRKATWDTRQQQMAGRQVAMTQERQNKLNTAFDKVGKEWSEGMPFFQKREGDNDWNSGVEERLALTNHIFSGVLEPEELAAAAHWAAVGPVALDMWQKQVSLTNQWKDAYSKLTGVQPDSLGTGAPQVGSGMPQPGTQEYMLRFTQHIDSLRKQG